MNTLSTVVKTTSALETVIDRAIQHQRLIGAVVLVAQGKLMPDADIRRWLRGLSVVAFTNTLYEGMSGQFVNDLRDAVNAQ